MPLRPHHVGLQNLEHMRDDGGDLEGDLEGDLTRTLDVELRPHGIRVNAMVPQLIATEKNRAFLCRRR